MSEEMYIKDAIYMGNFVIFFTSLQGERRTIDFKPLLQENLGDFNYLKNEDIFKNFYLDTNILTWDVDIPKKSPNQINKFDIAPEYIAEHSKLLILTDGEYRIRIKQPA